VVRVRGLTAVPEDGVHHHQEKYDTHQGVRWVEEPRQGQKQAGVVLRLARQHGDLDEEYVRQREVPEIRQRGHKRIASDLLQGGTREHQDGHCSDGGPAALQEVPLFVQEEDHASEGEGVAVICVSLRAGAGTS
jgi:hypothetical protein